LLQDTLHVSEALVSKHVVKVMKAALFVLRPCGVQKLCCWFEGELW